LLDNLFNTSFDAELVLSEQHLDGVDWVKKCVGRSWWKTCWYVPKTSYDSNEYTLAEIDLYNGSHFPLDFNTVSNTNGFSIHVGVPEPSSLFLFSIGLVGMLLYSRKRYHEKI